MTDNLDNFLNAKFKDIANIPLNIKQFEKIFQVYFTKQEMKKFHSRWRAKLKKNFSLYMKEYMMY